MSVGIGEILVFLSFTFLILEIFFASGGIFTFVGLTSFIIGTYFLYLSFNGLPSLFLYVVYPIFVGVFAFVVFVVILGLRAQKAPVKTTENLLGKTGVCKKPMTKNNPGQIDIEGEIWAAYSDEDVAVGQKVKVIEQKSLQLFVRKEE